VYLFLPRTTQTNLPTALIFLNTTNHNLQPTNQQILATLEKQKIAETIREQLATLLHSIYEPTQENLDIFLEYFVESNDTAWMENPALWVSNLTMLQTKE
jgi:hypothetical protein